jgi:hypothetical protein
VADSTYASLKLLFRCQNLSKPVTFITRLRLDAALYERGPTTTSWSENREASYQGRTALPNLSEVAEDPSTVWKPTKVGNWYGSGERMVEITSATAVCYSIRACSLCPYAGSWCAIRKASSKPRLSYLPSLKPTQRRSSPGLLCAGSSKQRSKRCADISASRAKGSGPKDSDTAHHPGAVGFLFSLVTLFAHRQMRQAVGAFRQAAWGSTRGIRPSSMCSPWRARSCGHNRRGLSAGRPRTPRR